MCYFKITRLKEKKNNKQVHLLIPITLKTEFDFVVYAQNMDPKVNIVETVPPSDGYLVRGTIARDVTLDCLVEDLLTDKQVMNSIAEYNVAFCIYE